MTGIHGVKRLFKKHGRRISRLYLPLVPWMTHALYPHRSYLGVFSVTGVIIGVVTLLTKLTDR